MALNFKVRLLLWLSSLQKQTLVDINLPAHEARQKSHKNILKNIHLLEFPPEKMHHIEDRTVKAGDGFEIPIRIYRPVATSNLPILMHFHGGGFVIGNLDIYDRVSRRMAKMANCVVVSVDYRLAPEYKFPTAPEDCYAATLWAFENAQAIGGNPDKIAVMGDSAGGNLATVVAMMARDRKGPKISFQALIYPVVDATQSGLSVKKYSKGFLLTKAQMDWFLDHYIDKSSTDLKHSYLSPLWEDNLQEMPPAYILTAENDPLKDEGAMYAEKLRKAGVGVEYQDYSGMIHGFFGMTKFLKLSQTAQQNVAEALKKAWV